MNDPLTLLSRDINVDAAFRAILAGQPDRSTDRAELLAALQACERFLIAMGHSPDHAPLVQARAALSRAREDA